MSAVNSFNHPGGSGGGIGFAPVSLTASNANMDRVNASPNMALSIRSNPYQLPAGSYTNDLYNYKRDGWYDPRLGYLNNSPPGYISPYVLQECIGTGRSRYCPDRCCERDTSAYYYNGYPGYYYGY